MPSRMSVDYSESVALFSKPQSTYTGQQGDDAGATDDAPGNNKQNGSIHDGHACNGQTASDGKVNNAKAGRQEPEWIPPEEESPSFDEIMGSIHEKAIGVVGFGRFQWMLFVVLGLAIMGDSVELVVTAYILPGAERDLCMDERMKGWLGAIAFVGMMVGSVIWGTTADKLGRRVTLMTSLGVNAVFSTVAALVPTYWLFLLCRCFSGLGIGGSIPIVFTYLAEFCPLIGRGQKVSLLLVFWAFGGIYVSALGWLIIPNDDIGFSIGPGHIMGSWRMFMLICTIPIYLSMFGLIFMPESPRFLLQSGKDLEALTVYRKVYSWNHTEAGAEYEMPEIELPTRPGIGRRDPPPPQRFPEELLQGLESFWSSLFQLFSPPLTFITLTLAVAWFSTSFGYYGLIIWFPEFMKKLQEDAFTAQRIMVKNETIRGDIAGGAETFTGLLSNVYYFNSTFRFVQFKDIVLQHVTFDMCLFSHVSFDNVSSIRTYFVESRVQYCTFNDTNFYMSRFQGTLFKNTTMVNLRPGCQVDFDTNYSKRQIFLENFLSQLALVPGVVISSILVDKVGRVRVLVPTLFVAAFSVFFIWVINSQVGVVIMNAIFNCVVLAAWNALDVLTAENYPTDLRTTGFGFLACLGRVAAILGNITFGNLISFSKSIPILITAAVMVLGAIVSVKLPESKNKLI